MFQLLLHKISEPQWCPGLSSLSLLQMPSLIIVTLSLLGATLEYSHFLPTQSQFV